MSGTQGPLETRTVTSYNTRAEVSGIDTTPFRSGELAYAIDVGYLYMLVYEATTPIDGFNALATLYGKGRWIRLCVYCAGVTGITGNTF